MNQLLKVSFRLILLILVVASLDSCRSYKSLSVLKEVNEQDYILKQPAVYKIKPGDNLFVSIITPDEKLNTIYNPAQVGIQAGANMVYNQIEGQFVYGYEVDRNGFVNLPVIGKVKVEGLSMIESEQAVDEKAREYLKDMSVKVRLLNYKVTVIGEVEAPGVYFNYNTEFTILDALSTAGGFTDFANLNEVKLIRPRPDGDKVYVLDLQQASSLRSEAFYTMPNDIITVMPAKNKNLPLQAQAITLVLATTTTILLLINVINP
jgi:polysaccharide export outer membrane protein